MLHPYHARISGLCLLLLTWPVPVAAETPDASALAAEMASFSERIDAPAFAKGLDWGAYVVHLYNRIEGREPTPREFAVFAGLRDHHGLKPSQALSLVLRGPEPCPTYDQIRLFLNTQTPQALVPGAHARDAARALAKRYAEIEIEEETGEAIGLDGLLRTRVAEEPDPPDVAYNVYFGFLHAHSHLSEDAEGDPLDAYAVARNVAGLDFFSLSDHGEFLALWPWTNDWGRLRDAADKSDEPGHFVALHGFEWSNPLLGHITVINSEDFTGTLRNFSMASIFRWIQARPESFAQFNHPGDYDFLGGEFGRFRLFTGVVDQMAGIELWNGSRSFEQYHYAGSWESAYSYLDAANRRGWRLGALGAQDNHRADWGLMNDFRTGVLAEELTREAIIDAYRHRRFYATEDKDLILDFRCNGYPMGSRVEGLPRLFTVSASDKSGDLFEEVRLYKNGDLLETKAVEGNAVEVSFSEDPAADTEDYYYVIVRQGDDNDGNGRNDEAISSPIWTGPPIERSAGCAGWDNGASEPDTAGMRGDAGFLFLGLWALWRARRQCPAGERTAN